MECAVDQEGRREEEDEGRERGLRSAKPAREVDGRNAGGKDRNSAEEGPEVYALTSLGRRRNAIVPSPASTKTDSMR